MKQPIKVGFDMDGVLLYNPARIARPLISIAKKRLKTNQKDGLKFFVPQPGIQQTMWDFVHKSSCFLAPGFSKILALREQGLIEPYLITARFAHLEKDFNKWMKKMDASTVFVEYFMNFEDQQPHLFKEKMVKKLKLQIFVEDNWDIVQHLSKSCTKTQVFWITNILDRHIEYEKKHLSLRSVLNDLA